MEDAPIARVTCNLRKVSRNYERVSYFFVNALISRSNFISGFRSIGRAIHYSLASVREQSGSMAFNVHWQRNWPTQRKRLSRMALASPCPLFALAAL